MLDVAIGVIFGFLVVSLVASTVLEALSSALKWRANDLRQGVQQLVGDPAFTGLALQLYGHAAINPRGTQSASQKGANAPAYIPSQQFATALMDIVELSGTAPEIDAALQRAIATGPLSGNPRLQILLTGIVQRSQGDLKQIETALGAWFDSGMDRLSGAYKRKTQLVSFLVALGLSVLLNVDSIHIAHVLWEQPNLADSLKVPPADDAKPNAAATAASADDAAARAIAEMDRHLPVGWTDELTARAPTTDPLGWVSRVLGWFITATATLFGAPFWFDTLQSVVRLKGTGPSPMEKTKDRAAAA